MRKIKLNIQDNIADTLFITLYAKSTETKKKNPLICDPVACRLVEKIDYDFSRYKNKTASSVGVALRASHFDRVVTQFIKTRRNPVVVLIGCGLDARVQRIGSIAGKAVFYELDIEEVINIRKRLLPPAENEHYIAGSMLATEWMDELRAKHPSGDFIFIIEGVLMYFSEADNKFVFRALARRFRRAEIHFDMLNKWMSARSSIHDTVSKTNAKFAFGIDNEKEIEKWHPALQHERTYLFNEFKGWRRMGFLLTALMSLIPAMKTSSRVMVYTIGSQPREKQRLENLEHKN